LLFEKSLKDYEKQLANRLKSIKVILSQDNNTKNKLLETLMKQLSSIELPEGYGSMIRTGLEPFDEIFGSDDGQYGFVQGKVYLLSAPMGTGKSRLSLTMESLIADTLENGNTGHFTSEQDELALKAMCSKAKVEIKPKMMVEKEDQWEAIKRKIVEYNLKFVVIDSLPMIMDSFKKIKDEESGQFRDMKVKEKMREIAQFTSDHGFVMLLINHCTKAGAWKGGSDIGHLVDAMVSLKVNTKDYDGVKVVEFRGGKNREGEPINRAFPFNGVWDLTSPYEIESAEIESGVQNESKVALRKAEQEESLMQTIMARGGMVHREELDAGDVSISGMAKSGVISLLRSFVDKGKLVVQRGETQGRGQPPIIAWCLPEGVEVNLPSITEQDEEQSPNLYAD